MSGPGRFHVKQAAAAIVVLLATAAHGSGETVRFPGPGVELEGRLYRPPGEGPFPAIVLLHGCSGLWGRDGEPTRSHVFWAEHFRERGYVAVLVDSFGPRGEREICTQKERRVLADQDRPRDAYAALEWLAGRPDVDTGRVHLMGWSNGAMAVLHSLRGDAPGRPVTGAGFRSAVAFYPGCNALLKLDFRPVAPLLIQAGGADDWTPSRPCETLARKSAEKGLPVEIDIYPGAHHAFDRIDLAPRFRPEVRNGSGWGATVGTHPEARARSIERVTAWIEARNR